jgi:hypothetical protein
MMRHSFKYNDVKSNWKKTQGVGYAKGGKGIEKVIGCKRKTQNTFCVQGKIKGKGHRAPFNGIVRERSKGEINALMGL